MDERVRRDRWGIPHLEAGDEIALARLQGRVCARDRVWQLELDRWRSEGRLAERIGLAGLGWDVLARQTRLDQTARRAHAALDERTRVWLAGYVEGVNAELVGAAERSAELRSLGATAPEPWRPWTPLGIFLAHHVLFGSFPAKLWRSLVAERVGEPALDWLSAEGVSGGSNAFAVAATLTASGSPLVGGDPHRTLTLPGPYTQVRLRCPAFDVAGFTFPGVPGVQHFAHAGSVAWGITNAAADHQDLYREQLRPGPDGGWQVRESTGWADVALGWETIRVHDGADVDAAVLQTARGPVVTGLDPAHAIGADPAPLHSLRTPSQVGSDLGFAALLPLLHARTVADVEQALTHWVEPVNSVLVADDTGTVRHLLAGRVPLRDPALRRLPGVAWEPGHRWSPGWCEREVTEVTTLAVNANDRASGGGLGQDYAPPHRAERLRTRLSELIADGDRVDVAAAADLAGDVVTRSVLSARPWLVGLRLTGPAEELRLRLLAWDGRCGIDSVDAAWWAAWRHALVGWLAEQESLAPLLAPHPYPALLAPALDARARLGRAWERLLHHGEELGFDPVDGVAEALRRTAAGPAPTTWGRTHRLSPQHGLGWTEGTEVAVPGDSACVFACSSTPGVSDAALRGPVARYLWDLSDRRRSGWVVPFGAAADPASPHHHDQLDPWLAVGLVPVEPAEDELVEDPLT